MDRRLLLRSLPSFLIASSAPSLWTPALAAKVKFPAALLIPQTGPHAALGRSMERAATLAQGGKTSGELFVFDTGSTAQGAAAAARAARKAGVTVILGPVFAHQVPAVLGVVGSGVPVLSFSNDAALLESGAFLFGITARQAVAAILAYAAGRGIRRVAIGGAGEGWGGQVRAAAATAAAAYGIETYPLPAGDITALPATASGASDGLPDAVLMADAATLARLAPDLAVRGVQPLGAFPGLDLSPEQLRTLDGAWLSAPDPARFDGFARNFEQRNGSRPGIIAALAYDAANIARQLRLGGGTDRSALLATGFRAICGDVRFREDGSATRLLAILAVSAAGMRTIATPAAA